MTEVHSPPSPPVEGFLVFFFVCVNVCWVWMPVSVCVCVYVGVFVCVCGCVLDVRLYDWRLDVNFVIFVPYHGLVLKHSRFNCNVVTRSINWGHRV